MWVIWGSFQLVNVNRRRHCSVFVQMFHSIEITSMLRFGTEAKLLVYCYFQINWIEAKELDGYFSAQFTKFFTCALNEFRSEYLRQKKTKNKRIQNERCILMCKQMMPKIVENSLVRLFNEHAIHACAREIWGWQPENMVYLQLRKIQHDFKYRWNTLIGWIWRMRRSILWKSLF